MYEVLPKSSEVPLPWFYHLPKLVFAPIHLEVVPICTDTAIQAGFSWSQALLEVFLRQRLHHFLRYGLDLFNAVETWPSELQFHLRELKKITSDEVQWVRRMGDDCNIRRSHKRLHNERHVSWSIVMMKGPGLFAPLVWMFAPDVLISISSEFRNRIFYSPSFLLEQIPYAWCLQNQILPHFPRGSYRGLSQTLFIIYLKPSVLEMLKPFVGLRFAWGIITKCLGHYHQMPP